MEKAGLLNFLKSLCLVAGLSISVSSAYAAKDEQGPPEGQIIKFCSKARTVIDSGPLIDAQVRPSGWSQDQLMKIARAFQAAATPLCNEKVIKDADAADFGPIHFFDNPDANIISIFNEDLGYGPKVITIEIPSRLGFDHEDLTAEMRRALLCGYNPEASELDETACLPD